MSLILGCVVLLSVVLDLIYAFCVDYQPQTLQLDFLMKILPNYHHLKKTVKSSSTPARS